MCDVAAGAVGDGWNALKRIEVGLCLLDLSVGVLTQCLGPEVDLMPRLAVCLCGAMAQAALQPLQHYNRCCVVPTAAFAAVAVPPGQLKCLGAAMGCSLPMHKQVRQ